MLNRALLQAKTVAIAGHVRPDGDCVGSCMSLYQYIKDNYNDVIVDVYLEEIPESIGDFFPGTHVIRHTIDENQIYDVFFALDCGDERRLGFSAKLYENAKKTICIDHHISNQAFADENYIYPNASSTAELVYQLLEKEKITTEIAEYLYLGLTHDTGVFQYSCTAPETMEIAADLLRRNVRACEIVDKTFFEKTFAQNKALGKALLDSCLYLDGKCIVSYFTKENMDVFGVTPKDLDGVVSQLRVTQGAETAIFLYETGENEFKASLRASGDVDVSKVACAFGGGGHVKAAGVTMNGTPNEIIDILVNEIAKQL